MVQEQFPGHAKLNGLQRGTIIWERLTSSGIKGLVDVFVDGCTTNKGKKKMCENIHVKIS